LGFPPVITEIAEENETIGIEYYRADTGTICRFYNNSRIVIQHNTDTLEYRPQQGTFYNNRFKYPKLAINDFVKFWETKNSYSRLFGLENCVSQLTRRASNYNAVTAV
jgi:hypothetical protein